MSMGFDYYSGQALDYFAMEAMYRTLRDLYGEGPVWPFEVSVRLAAGRLIGAGC